jgi:hypothetical protein
MSEIQNAIRELSTILKEITLPAGFLESYDQLECLSTLMEQKPTLCSTKARKASAWQNAMTEKSIRRSMRTAY